MQIKVLTIENMDQEKTHSAMQMFGVSFELRKIHRNWEFTDKEKIARMLYGLHQTYEGLEGEQGTTFEEFVTAYLS